jgi:hypothetical protein
LGKHDRVLSGRRGWETPEGREGSRPNGSPHRLRGTSLSTGRGYQGTATRGQRRIELFKSSYRANEPKGAGAEGRAIARIGEEEGSRRTKEHGGDGDTSSAELLWWMLR